MRPRPRLPLGDGDGDTQETEDWGGADYGGPGPTPCEDTLAGAMTLQVGSNAIDTTAGSSAYETICGPASGSGPDQVLEFIAPADGNYSFGIANASFDAWLLEFGTYYCSPYNWGECAPNQGLDIQMSEGSTLYLMLDGAAGGTATIEVTQVP